MASAPTTIQCADCGLPYKAIRKNAKVCRICRLIRNLKFYKDSTRECWGCEAKYSPWDGHQVFCGRCDDSPQRASEAAGECALCKHSDYPLIHADIRVCRVCAMDPEKRPLFFRALVKKQRLRIDEAKAVAA